jgi:hypothetical protein
LPSQEVKKLTAIFRKLGARNPEEWASSQIEEEIPQLARFLFLKQAWGAVLSDADTEWIDASIASAERRPDQPYAGVGHGLKRLLAAGAAREDITDVVRGMQAELLFNFCYLLEDPGDLPEEVAEIQWALIQLSEEGRPLAQIGGLHESVLETDPTGREMRPRRPGV